MRAWKRVLYLAELRLVITHASELTHTTVTAPIDAWRQCMVPYPRPPLIYYFTRPLPYYTCRHAFIIGYGYTYIHIRLYAHGGDDR